MVVGVSAVALEDAASGQTTTSFGAGSAVTRVDRSANFDPINADGIALSDYTEGSLFIGVDGDSLTGFDPYHGTNGTSPTFEYPADGSYGWVTIHATDGRPVFAVEFTYANGWTTGDATWPWGDNLAYVEWETWKGGSLVSSGTIGGGGLVIDMGTVIGFQDPAGFDELHVRCRIATSADPNLQALVVDHLIVQLWDASASWANYGTGWAGTLGVPTITPSAEPVLGTSITVTISNSFGAPTPGLVVVGLTETNLATGRGGSLLVDPLMFMLENFPATGFALAGTFPPYDPAFVGVEIDLQALELDPGATKGYSFTPGLKLILGV
jgi:hypothetical protein